MRWRGRLRSGTVDCSVEWLLELRFEIIRFLWYNGVRSSIWGRFGFDGDCLSMSCEPGGCAPVTNASVNINAKNNNQLALAA